LEALVADLLALSRLESPVSEFKPMTVDWRRFCDELSEKWTDAVGKKQLHWEWSSPPDLREAAIRYKPPVTPPVSQPESRHKNGAEVTPEGVMR